MPARKTPRLKPFQVCELTYCCRLSHPSDMEGEEGIIRAYWTGEIDTWGKRTICPVDGTPTLYLFADEITDIETLEGK